MRQAVRAAVCALVLCALALTLTHLRLPVGEGLRLFPNSPRGEEAPNRALPCGAVDLNRASLEELQTLPGVGAVLAQRIVREREENGPFAYPQDLLCVKGIGQKTLQKLWNHICLNK